MFDGLITFTDIIMFCFFVESYGMSLSDVIIWEDPKNSVKPQQRQVND